MASPKAQLAMVVDDPEQRAADREAEIESEFVLRERLWSAMRTFAANYSDPDTGKRLGWDGCAAELEARWGRKGRPVSASVLRAALHDAERNNFRGEWFIWFSRQCEDVADLVLEMGGGGRSEKKPEDELRDLKDVVRREFPKQAEALIRKGKAPRR